MCKRLFFFVSYVQNEVACAAPKTVIHFLSKVATRYFFSVFVFLRRPQVYCRNFSHGGKFKQKVKKRLRLCLAS